MEKKEQREHLAGVSEVVTNAIDMVAKVLVYGGGLVALLCIGLLLFTLFRAGDMAADRIAGNVGLVGGPVVLATLAVSIGVAWLTWGEEVTGPILAIIGLVLFFLPAYGGAMIAPDQMDKAKAVTDALSRAGIPAIILGLIMFIGDRIIRVRVRLIQGARLEQMKYGQGVREERDVKNVFLGKCWQLPYCRKFVREKCPIYHARRTCWKERVGCMCEEQVIRNAMSGVVISKDIVAAAKMIPRNNTITLQQKKQRCNQCIIYNEHQKHKYKALIPAVICGSLILAVGIMPLGTGTIQNGLRNMSHQASQLTQVGNSQQVQAGAVTTQAPKPDSPTTVTDVSGVDGKIPYAGIIYFTCVLVGVAYAVRVVEFLIFKHII